MNRLTTVLWSVIATVAMIGAIAQCVALAMFSDQVLFDGIFGTFLPLILGASSALIFAAVLTLPAAKQEVEPASEQAENTDQ